MMIKKAMAILIIALTIGGSVIAQKKSHDLKNKSPEEASKFVTEKMTEKLELTSEQATAVQAILLESFTSKKEISEKYPEMSKAKEEMKAIKKESKSAIKEVLTDEQKEMLKERKKNHDAAPMKKGKKTKPTIDEKVARMKENANLSAAQEKQIREILEKSKQQKLELEKKYPEYKAAKEEQKANKEKTKTELKKVLTAEQYEKYLKLKKGKNQKGKKGKGPHKKGKH